MKCDSCGASIEAGLEKCSFCGTLVKSTASQTKNSVFDRLKESDIYSRSQTTERLDRLPKMNNLMGIGGFSSMAMIPFVVITAGMGCAMLYMSFRMRSSVGFGRPSLFFSIIPALMSIVPFGMAAAALLATRKLKKNFDKVDNSETYATPVIVVDKRTQVWGGGGDSSANTNYYVTCENETGTRQEYLVWNGVLYGKMTAGDTGILFVKESHGIDFDRVDLNS